MKRGLFLISAISVALWCAAVCAEQPGADAPRRPNLVFVLLDNLGKEWIGAYGSDEGVTPQIDRLARAGVRIENCYTPTVCGPSRVTVLTGRYLLRSGMTLHHDAALYSGGGLDPRREITFARPLKQAGYATAIFGKWQINHLYDEPDVIRQHGFDEYLLWPGSLDRDRVSDDEYRHFMERVLANDFAFTTEMIRRIESRYWDVVTLDHRQQRRVHRGRFGPDVFQEAAYDFIRRHRDQPFLLYLPSPLTHGWTFTDPVTPTPWNMDTDRPDLDMYRDMVRYADHLVGQLVEELERQDILDRTIVFVATDNGTESSFSARFQGRVVPGELYRMTEPGGNVPLIVYGPQRIPGGRTIRLADFSDLLPTFCELAGVPLPEGVTIDGRSFAGTLLDPEVPEPRSWIFNQYHQQRVVSDGRFKLYADGRLFDLQQDFAEQEDLAAACDLPVQAARQRLQAVLDSLPPDSQPPFPLRSQSAFRLRSGHGSASK
jgi:arylsulfatase A-like enzyme